jgi:arsenate reductase
MTQPNLGKPKVVFICLGNSCRSIMAEALARHLWGDVPAAASAGIHPLGFVARETLEVLSEMGVNPEGLRSKGLKEIDLTECRLIVNLTDYSLEALVPAPGQGKIMNHAVLDPYGGDLDRYRESRDAIHRFLLEDLTAALTWS